MERNSPLKNEKKIRWNKAFTISGPAKYWKRADPLKMMENKTTDNNKTQK